MSLELIVGPPNSGRTGVVLERFSAALARDPILVVPTWDDVERFERELCAGGAPVVGGLVLTFPRLFEEAGRRMGVASAPIAGDAQRLRVAREAIGRARIDRLVRSARRPGFAAACLEMVDEVLSAGLDTRTLAERAREQGGRYEVELAALCSAYQEVMDEVGRSDSHTRARAVTAALRANPEPWERSPVLLYGFDDLSAEQTELVAALAGAAEVTVALPWEDRAAMAARSTLQATLLDLGGRVVQQPPPSGENTDSEALYRLERRFLTDVDPDDPIEPDDGLVFLQAAGERSQVELIGTEIARLLDQGQDPGEIAIVLRDVDRQGALYDRLLRSWRIPVAVEASMPLRATAVGRGMLGLLRAAVAGGDAEDVLAFLRTPGRAGPGSADWFERQLRREGIRTGDQALEEWRRTGSRRELFEVSDLRNARTAKLPATLARLARMVAQYPHRRQAAQPGPDIRHELRAAEIAARAGEELAELELPTPAAELVEVLAELRVPLWGGSTEGRVRVLNPYRVRARRVQHLFVASLQGGEFPRRDPRAGLLGPESRARLGLPTRAAPDEEERYLFYVCLTRPSRRLYLSSCTTGDEGEAAEQSPFLDEVCRLLRTEDGSPASAPDRLVRRRTPGEVAFAVEDAPTFAELARSLAASGAGATTLASLDVPDREATAIGQALAQARALAADAPGPLSVPAVIEALGEVERYGASTLEDYALCSYRWFVGHELAPEPLGPVPEGLVAGGIAHAVLEALYRERPAGSPIPRPETLDEWVRRAHDLVAETADERGLAERGAASRAARRRIEGLVVRFLREEAGREPSLAPRPDLIEAGFGDEPGDKAALDLGGFGLHGRIDRVDVDDAETPTVGLVHDYKLSAQATAADKLAEEGKLQPQLYMLALRELWGIRPIGGLYRPLAERSTPAKPRGLARRSEAERLEGLNLTRTDLYDDDAFERAIDEAKRQAVEIVGLMRAGRIDRNPLGGECPRFCEFQTICRRERSARLELEIQAGDEDEEPEEWNGS